MSLAPSQTATRIPRLRDRLGDAGCDALLVTRLVNVRYLTGFTGSAGMLLVLPDDVVLATDGRYRDQSAEQLAESRMRDRFRPILREAIQDVGLVAANPPEAVAQQKIVEELLDRLKSSG